MIVTTEYRNGWELLVVTIDNEGGTITIRQGGSMIYCTLDDLTDAIKQASQKLRTEIAGETHG